MRGCKADAHHWQMTWRVPLATHSVIAGWVLLAALSMAAWHEAFAESPPGPEGTATNHWPSEIVLTQPVEFPTAAGGGRTGAVQALPGGEMNLTGVHGNNVEAAIRNLAAQFPTAATNLAARMEAQRRAMTGESRNTPSTATAEGKPQANRNLPGGKTFIEASMNPETFKASGLDKLSRAEIEVLDRWFLTVSTELLLTSRAKTTSQQEKETAAVSGRKNNAALERVLLVKDFNGDKVLIQRSNGERWLLRAKTWCRWSWRYEGRYVSLLFGSITSQLINDEGDSFNFWVDNKVD